MRFGAENKSVGVDQVRVCVLELIKKELTKREYDEKLD